MTAADTWMAFYVGDYVKNTLKLTTRQHGAYLLLILACWQDGGSVDGDDKTLASITKLSMKEWLRDRPKLAAYFDVTPQKWTHRRVVDELAESARRRRERSAAGRRGATRRWQEHGGATAGAVTERSQNDAQSPSQSPPRSQSSPHALEVREPTARLIPEDWQPAEPDVVAMRRERPDVVGEVYERRMRDFRDWCRAKAVISHDFASTWRSFMRRTDPSPSASQQTRRPDGGRPAEHRPSIRMAGPECLWKVRLSGYRPGDPWKYEGDPPGGSNCKVPAELIRHWRAYVRDLEEAG